MTETTSYSVPEGTKLRLRTPDDFHHHFRDGLKIGSVIQHASQRFARAIAMPNLKPPVTTTDAALRYRQTLLESVSSSIPSSETKVELLEPLMTLYLTDNTSSEEIHKAHKTGYIHAAKYYPAGATTNSDYGVTCLTKTYKALKAMEECRMILCIHSEVSRCEIDIFDRERLFIEEVMKPLVRDFPNLQIVMEHISTEEAVQYVLSCPPNVAATITPHHMLYNRNALLVGGIKPHYYCLPILKRERHRRALLHAATSGNPKFFAGTDSAPHSTSSKESSCGCAGVYTAHAAVELYAEAFECCNRLDRLEDFLSTFGAKHYGLSLNDTFITLVKSSWLVPSSYDFGDDETVTPLRANEKVLWKLIK